MTMPAGLRIDELRTGYYQRRFVRGGVWVPVKIWKGQPPDPDNPGQLLDRSIRWMAEVDGQFWHGDMQELWIACGSHPIREAEYRYLLARRKHAQDHEPESPFAAPRKRVDMNTAPPPSFGRK